jgi:hypothetical protein
MTADINSIAGWIGAEILKDKVVWIGLDRGVVAAASNRGPKSLTLELRSFTQLTAA